tara:strand:- start:17938 stop:20124 length:2187 start_codon:yes stop_codon:yes gene_type:complete
MTVRITLGNLPTAEDIAKLRAQKQARGLQNESEDTVRKMFAQPIPEKKVATTYRELGADPSLATTPPNITTKMFDTTLSSPGSTGLYGTDKAVSETKTGLETMLQSVQTDFAKLSNSSNTIIRNQVLELQRKLNNNLISVAEFQLKVQQLKTTSIGLGGFYQNILSHQKTTLDNNAAGLNKFYKGSSKFTPTPGQDGTYEMTQVNDSMITSTGYTGYETSVLGRNFEISDKVEFTDGKMFGTSLTRFGPGDILEGIFGERDTYKISSFNADQPIYLNAMVLGLYQSNTGNTYGPGADVALSNFGFGGDDILSNVKNRIRDDLEQSLLGTTEYTKLSEKDQKEKLNSLTENVYEGLLKEAETLFASTTDAPIYATSMLEKHKMLIDNHNTRKEILYSSMSTNYAIAQDIENFTNYFTTNIKAAFGGEIPTELTGLINELDDMYVEGILGLDGQVSNKDEMNIMISKLAPINLHVLSVMAENAGLDYSTLFDDNGNLSSKKNKEFFNKAKAAGLVDESGSVIGAISDGLIGRIDKNGNFIGDGVLAPEAIIEAKKIRNTVVQSDEARYGNAVSNYRRDLNRFGVNTRKNKVAMDVNRQQNLYRGVLTGEMAVLNEELIAPSEATQEKIQKAIEDFFTDMDAARAPATEERPMGIDQEAPNKEQMLDILYNTATLDDISSTIEQYNIFDTNKLRPFIYAYADELALDQGVSITEDEQNDFYNTFINRTRVG